MRKKSVVTDHSGGYDPHASTVDPDDPRLKVARRKGRSIRKGPVAGVVGVVLGLLMLAVSLALLPREKAHRETERRAPVAAERYAIPDMIRNAPDNDDPVLVEAPVDELFAGELSPSEEESFTDDSLPVSGRYVAPSGIDSGVDQEQDAYDRALEASPFFQGAGEMSPMSGLVAQGKGGMVCQVACLIFVILWERHRSRRACLAKRTRTGRGIKMISWLVRAALVMGLRPGIWSTLRVLSRSKRDRLSR